MHKLVITQAHFVCGQLIGPTTIKFTTEEGGELVWSGLIRRYVDKPVAINMAGEGNLFIEHETMSSVSICNSEKVLMRTQRHTFDQVKLSVKATAPCGKCGAKCSRTKVFMQTLNPFNTNDDGSLKTRDQIMAEHSAKAREYRNQPIYHVKCEE